MDAPLTQYAVRDGTHIGYQVWGSGPVDVLEFNSGLMISIDETIDEPSWLRYTERLAGFCRLVRFDAAGLGLSDPLAPGTVPSIEGWGRDALAVMDAVGFQRPIVIGQLGGAMPAIWLAATHPERLASLVIINGTARVGEAEDYGFGVPSDLTTTAADIEVPEEDGVPQDIATFAPSLAHRVGFRAWWERAARRGASPSTAVAFNVVTFSADVRSFVPAIHCPTLVVSRTETYHALHEHGRYLAEHIEGARFATVPGADLVPWAGEFDALVDEVEEFVTGSRSSIAATRTLATVLFTDIVDSTVRAARDGDRRWRAVLDELDLSVDRILARHDGILVKTTGDGILARFASPAEALRCAAEMVEAASAVDLELRAGVHAGEVELRGNDIGGLAVHIASRVSAMADAGEVLTTGTVRDLTVGSDIGFDDRGRHILKGVPGEWQVLAMRLGKARAVRSG
jgi:class 3 adenylate cyclase